MDSKEARGEILQYIICFQVREFKIHVLSFSILLIFTPWRAKAVIEEGDFYYPKIDNRALIELADRRITFAMEVCERFDVTTD
ncbi:MAG: hypothetical protein ACTS73_02030 [Arsenophonus sp. NEOnobi-MAG3]